MGIVSWLHLSDWHHRCPISGDRKKKRKRLLEDIQKQTESLGAVDFILFSGDITNSGAKEEFDEVKTQLIDPGPKPAWRRCSDLLRAGGITTFNVPTSRVSLLS